MKTNFTPFPEIETERLILRRLNENDAREIYHLRSDSVVNKFINRPETSGDEDALKFINKINEGINRNEAIYWGISLKNKKELIGTICLWNISAETDSAETGYELLPQYWGNGYIQEALQRVLDYGFEMMGLNSVEAYVHPENERSIKVLRRFGFEFLKKADEGEELVYWKKADKTGKQ